APARPAPAPAALTLHAAGVTPAPARPAPTPARIARAGPRGSVYAGCAGPAAPGPAFSWPWRAEAGGRGGGGRWAGAWEGSSPRARGTGWTSSPRTPPSGLSTP